MAYSKNDFPFNYGMVTLRKKPRRSGGFTLYLDIYKGKGEKRKCEALRQILIPENTPADKRANKQSLIDAQLIAQQRNEEENKRNSGRPVERLDQSLLDACRLYECSRMKGREKTSRSKIIEETRKHLALYVGGEEKLDRIQVKFVDRDFCRGFVDYLKSAKGLVKSSILKPHSQRIYMNTFSSILRYAVCEGYIDNNPMTMLDKAEKKINLPEKGSTREFLLESEIRTLAESQYEGKFPDVKNGFMLSCFCGLRLSDIYDLTWGHIIRDGEKVSIKKTIVKTKKMWESPIPKSGVRWIPERPAGAKDTDKVFHLCHKEAISETIERWVKSVGINKHISFHCARHTFATLALTKGADLYVVSKLMGHSNIEVTQIYAKVIDERKEQAVKLMDDVL